MCEVSECNTAIHNVLRRFFLFLFFFILVGRVYGLYEKDSGKKLIYDIFAHSTKRFHDSLSAIKFFSTTYLFIPHTVLAIAFSTSDMYYAEEQNEILCLNVTSFELTLKIF